MGSFTLHKNSAKPAVGPRRWDRESHFFSAVQQADHNRIPHNLYLFYSNGRPEDAPFVEPLQKLSGGRKALHRPGQLWESQEDTTNTVFFWLGWMTG